MFLECHASNYGGHVGRDNTIKKSAKDTTGQSILKDMFPFLSGSSNNIQIKPCNKFSLINSHLKVKLPTFLFNISLLAEVSFVLPSYSSTQQSMNFSISTRCSQRSRYYARTLPFFSKGEE